jgi:hypothetical protein
LPEDKHEEAFRVIDRRPFTAEGDIRQDVVDAEERKAEREAQLEAARHPATPSPLQMPANAQPPADAPKASPAFENLIRMIGSNAAMVLGAYADPRSGQPVIDPEAARKNQGSLGGRRREFAARPARQIEDDLSGSESGTRRAGRQSSAASQSRQQALIP